MLFLLFQLGNDRYALEANRVVEIVPMLELKQLPQAPNGFAGLFNYRGRPVPALDLCQLTLGQAAAERLSTRIIVINCPDGRGGQRLLGLIAERATEMLRRNPRDFVDPGFKSKEAPYLGPVLLDPKGTIQWINEQNLLSEHVRSLLFAEPVQLTNGAN
jgi:chemotaxis-related protein WspB